MTLYAMRRQKDWRGGSKAPQSGDSAIALSPGPPVLGTSQLKHPPTEAQKLTKIKIKTVVLGVGRCTGHGEARNPGPPKSTKIK